SYALVGAHAEAWKHRHIHSHHYAPNVKDYDCDLQITSLIRVEPTSDHKWFHRYQHWYAPVAYMTYSLYWISIKDFVNYWKDAIYPGKRSFDYHISFWIQKCSYIFTLLIFPLMFCHQSPAICLLAFCIMHLVQSQFLLFTFFITHHVEKTSYYVADKNGFIKTSWLRNQVKSSNDFYPFSRTANFIFGGFNNHVAHHLFPHIPHVLYPELNKIIYPILKQQQLIPNETGFFTGIRSHLKHLKNMSVKKCDGNCGSCERHGVMRSYVMRLF
ncbi:MAG TPA: fatty acid desaturase, partial [Ferruginibacter sp.]|nr:fatty acid desaturase [Ferruginibacter sp.]